MQDLGPADAFYSDAFDINESGVIVGWARIADVGDLPVLWDDEGMTVIGTLLGAIQVSEARGINNLGQVVGHSLYESEVCYSCPTAILWEDGEMTELPRFPCEDCLRSEANDINNAGQIVGDAVLVDVVVAVLRAEEWTLTAGFQPTCAAATQAIGIMLAR